MRLDYVPHGAPDCPLLRITDFTKREIATLQDAARELADGESACVRLEERLALGDDVRLHLHAGRRDAGIQRTPRAFEFVLTPLTWRDVLDLIEPFLAEAPRGYQWLDTSGEVALLLSRDGRR